MTLTEFLQRLQSQPETIGFADSMAVIEAHYHYQPTSFSNGDQANSAGTNEGSCKILAFGLLHGLTPQQTLHCFGEYYRNDVLQNPHSDNHRNIRQFMQYGWEGVKLDGEALKAKNPA